MTESDKISCPQPRITYGYICKNHPQTNVWCDKFDDAVSIAEKDQPLNRPYYIVERVEHFDICGEVK